MLIDNFTTYTSASIEPGDNINGLSLDDLTTLFEQLKAVRPPDWIDGLIISKLVKPGEYWRKEAPDGKPYGMLHPADWIRQSYEMRRANPAGLLGMGLGLPVYESDEMAARLLAGSNPFADDFVILPFIDPKKLK